MEFLKQNKDAYPRRESVLAGKKVLFCGDSICAASVYDYKDQTFWGWAGRIASASGLSYINLGRDGASLSTCRGENRILTQIEKAKGEQFDMIVLHGGVNDAWDSWTPGKMTASFDLADFDTDTCAGGLEELFYYTKKYFPDTKICFVANFACPSSRIGRIANMDEYFDGILAICKKWGIPALDLYHDGRFSETFKVQEKINTADFVHPNGQGYDLLYLPIMKFMEEQF
ncbi:MAG: SGNH/GDSL hydrolase family protein [Clostridia bacterium]|nr:SGNH/GDSL hydrolase family protein [Clostridia bacterium]